MWLEGYLLYLMAPMFDYCLQQSTSELWLTKHRSKLEVRRHFFTEQMEQFGSSRSECKYREQFQEWSAATETISDGFVRGLKSD